MGGSISVVEALQRTATIFHLFAHKGLAFFQRPDPVFIGGDLDEIQQEKRVAGARNPLYLLFSTTDIVPRNPLY